MKVSRSLFLAACLVTLPATQAALAENDGQAGRPAAKVPIGEIGLGDRAFLADTVLEEMLGEALGEQALRRPGGARYAVHAKQMRDVHGLQAGSWRGVAVMHDVRTPEILDAERFAILIRAGQASDADYERTFARTALRLHLMAVDRLETQAREGADAGLRQAAAKAIPEAMVLVRASQALRDELSPIGM